MVVLGVVAAGALLGVVVVELSHYLAMGGVVASSRAGHSARGRTSEAVIVLSGRPPPATPACPASPPSPRDWSRTSTPSPAA
jgi:hypothetical protein